MRSILQADDILRRKVLSYLNAGGTSGAADDSDVIFPERLSTHLFALLHGQQGTCRGQTVHQVLRDPSALRKQLFYGVCKALFNDTTIRRVSDAWRHHAQLFPCARYDLEEFQQHLQIWMATIKQTTLEAVTVAAQELLYRCCASDRFCRYVDWLAVVGVVPVVDRALTAAQQERADELVGEFLRTLRDAPLLASSPSTHALLRQLVERLLRTDVPNTEEVRVRRLRRHGQIQAFVRDKAARVHVAHEPLAYQEGGLIMTSPLAHLYRELLTHYELRCHRKMCQLLNTFPVKALTTSAHETSTRRIIEHLEKRDKVGDAKVAIVKFLLNLSESKSKVGLDDSVQAFLQDVTPAMVDPDRLLPSRGPYAPGPAAAAAAGGAAGGVGETLQDIFKRQVVKCLEQQLQEQTDEIEHLKRLNEILENRAREFHTALQRSANEAAGHRRAALQTQEQLETMGTLDALDRVQGLAFTPLTLDDNRQVANSFFAQFVPEMRHADERLSELWEHEYIRTFRFQRNVTYQGAESSLMYSNYTIERVILPFLINVLRLPHLDPIPEQCLFFSFHELVNVVYEESRLSRYVSFVCNRELAHHRRALAAAAAAAAAAAETLGGGGGDPEGVSGLLRATHASGGLEAWTARGPPAGGPTQRVYALPPGDASAAAAAAPPPPFKWPSTGPPLSNQSALASFYPLGAAPGPPAHPRARRGGGGGGDAESDDDHRTHRRR